MTVGAIGRRVGLIVVVGLATGALTQLGQGLLPEGWSQAANAISPWLLVAFLLGSTMPDDRWAAAAGIGALLFALVGYYTMTELRYGIGAGTGSLLFWGAAAVVGGPVFGIAGRWWRTSPSHRRRAMAIGLLAAVVVAEGLYLILILPEAVVGAGFVAVGAVVPLVIGRSRDDRLGGYVAIVPALLLGALGYVVFQWLYAWTATVG
jgi:hypothetical protein